MNSQFGDASGGNVGTANASELDGVFAHFEPGFLNILFTGNLETNFNKLEIFFDAPTIGTGQNVLNTGGNLDGLRGLTFDTGCAPDRFLRINGGSNNGALTFFVDTANLIDGQTANPDFRGSTDGLGAPLGGGNGLAGLEVAVNNSNSGGVGSYNENNGLSGDPSSVTTGVGFRIPTSFLGDVDFGTGVRVAAFITGGGGNFLSNQVLGGLPVGTPNLEAPSGVNFNNFAGNQFFAVPEPASTAAIALGLLGFLARRRRAR